jgi:replicative DNA helicase
VYALAGIPGVGKTTFLNQLCDAFAKDDIPTVYFLTEEPDFRLVERTVKKEGLNDMSELKGNQPKILEYRRTVEMTPEYTAENLKDILQGVKLRLEMKEKHYPVFILDSLQALRLSKEEAFKDTRTKTIIKTEYLSYIARDLGIPVIFTSFMAREHYKDKTSKPSLQVFKEAGDIEYLIDVGLCLWTEGEDELKKDKPDIKLYFVKNRFGGYGETNLRLIKEKCKFKV